MQKQVRGLRSNDLKNNPAKMLGLFGVANVISLELLHRKKPCFLKKLRGGVLGLNSATTAADCGPAGQSVRILGSDFPAIQAVAGTAEANCKSSAAQFTVNLRDNTRDMMNQALTPNPAEYTSVIVANSTLTQLMNDDLVRPLNGLVEKYGAHLKPNQLITIDGKIMAVAFMANSQHMFTRTDILKSAGVNSTPKSVEEMVAAAKKIAAAYGISNCHEHESGLERR